MNAPSILLKSRRAFGTLSTLYMAGSVRRLNPGAATVMTRNTTRMISNSGNTYKFCWDVSFSLPSFRHVVASAKSNPALTYGCLAGTTWFAVYGLTGGFRNSKIPNVNIGYDHYPV